MTHNLMPALHSPLKAPKVIMAAIRTRHPEIHLFWHGGDRCWRLWQKCGQSWFLVAPIGHMDPETDTFLAERPTMENTVRFLDEMRPDKFLNRWRLDEFVNQDERQNEEAHRHQWESGRDQRREDAGYLYDKLKLGKIQIQR